MSLPTRFRKIVAKAIGTNFREVTEVVEVPLTLPKGDDVLVRTAYVGINASDINFTNGVYLPGVKPPFDVGFEAIGEVAAVGPSVSGLGVGDAVGLMHYGAFAEYVTMPAARVIPLPSADPTLLPTIVSGLTASICASCVRACALPSSASLCSSPYPHAALARVGEMRQGETVLVTAAAGGTGQFAVQLAKRAGNRVIGTCGSDDKVGVESAGGGE